MTDQPLPTPQSWGKFQGTPVDDAQIKLWADEAEAGYDLGAAKEGFVRGNDRLARLLADRAERVAAIRAQMDADDEQVGDDEGDKY